jgi:Zn-dependent protease with chaperone function
MLRSAAHAQSPSQGETPVLNNIKLVGIFLAIPLICFFILSAALPSQEEAWSQFLRENVPVERRAELALSIVCYDAAFLQTIDLTPVCSPYINTKRLRVLSTVAATSAILYAALILVAGVICKTNRRLLLRLFRPGLVFSNIVVAVLLGLQGILLAGAVLYAGYDGVMDENFYFYAVLIGLATLAGVFFTVKPLFGSARRAQTAVVGRYLSHHENPKLWEFVTALANLTGTDSPQNLIVGLTPAFFVTESDVYCIDRRVTGRTMYLSVPLCRILTIEELSAVIAHELGHFRGEDTAFSLHFYPIYQGAIDSLNGVSETAANITKVGGYIPLASIRILALLASLTLLPSIYARVFLGMLCWS